MNTPAKKIRCIDDEGKEVYEDDDPYAFLRFQEAGQLKPARKPKQLRLTAIPGADADVDNDEDEEERPDPELAISKLEAASAELAVAVDLVDNVASLKAVMVQYADARRDDSKKKMDVVRNKATMVRDKALLVEARQRQLREAAARLRSAARLLRSSVERENKFVADLLALQTFWRIRRPRSEHAPFVIDLSFPLSQSAASQSSNGGDTGPPRPPSERLIAMQGLDGNVVVSCPVDQPPVPTVQGAGEGSAGSGGVAAPPPPTAVGAKEAHALLLQRLAKLFFRAVQQQITWESGRRTHALFTQPLIQRTLCAMADGGGHSQVRLLRPVVMSLMVPRLAPEVSVLQRRANHPELSVALVQHWQHRYFVSLLLRSIDGQVRQYPGTVAHVLPTGRPHTTALLVDGGSRGILVVYCREMTYSVQSMPRGPAPLNSTRWVSEHYRKHLAQQELSTILERYWGQEAPSGGR